jgi:hypothetical protein
MRDLLLTNGWHLGHVEQLKCRHDSRCEKHQVGTDSGRV